MTDTPSRRPGRPDFQPSDEQRTTVRDSKAAKATNAAIARALGISPGTLRKHFAAELGTQPPAPAQLDFGGAAHKVAVVVEPTEHQVTSETKRRVRLWVLADWTEPRMAKQLDISVAELREHYMHELEFGADAVATQTLLDLERQSREGKTAASGRLLELYRQVAPPPPPKADAPDLGKKAQANADALTAHQDTDWEVLMGDAPASRAAH